MELFELPIYKQDESIKFFDTELLHDLLVIEKYIGLKENDKAIWCHFILGEYVKYLSKTKQLPNIAEIRDKFEMDVSNMIIKPSADNAKQILQDFMKVNLVHQNNTAPLFLFEIQSIFPLEYDHKKNYTYLFKIFAKPSVEHLTSLFMQKKELGMQYPLTHLFFKEYEYLAGIKHFWPIYSFFLQLMAENEGKISRKEAVNITMKQYLSDHIKEQENYKRIIGI